MVLYAIEYIGPCSDYNPSIVTIFTTLKNAEKAKQTYEDNCIKNNIRNVDYIITEIDTDKTNKNGCVYDYSSSY